MIIRKTLLYVPAGTLGPLLHLVTVLVLTYWLTPAEIGIYAIAVALQDLAQIATLSWWSQYLLRYLDDGRTAVRELQDRTEFGVLLVAAAVQMLLVTGLMVALGAGHAGPVLIASAAVSGAARALVTHWSVRARAAQLIGLHAFAQIAGPGLSLALTLLGFVAFGPSLTLAFLAMAVGHLIVAGVMAPGLAMTRVAGRIDRPILESAFGYGIFTTIGAGLAWVSMQSVRFITDAVLGTAAVGLLHVGWGIGQRVATQLAILGTAALFPIAARKTREGDYDEGVRQLMMAGPILVAVLVPATVGLTWVAEPFARLLTAPEFHQSTAAILPFAMLTGAVRVFRNHYLDDILQLTGQPRLMTWFDALEAGVTLVLCALGIIFHGLFGGIIGCLAAAIFTTALASVYITRRFGPPVPLRALIVTAVATGVMVMTLRALPSPDGLTSLVLVVATAGAAYVLSYALMEYRTILALAGRDRART